MRNLERLPAVRQITTDRRDVFAIELTGEFTSADAENLCGLLEGAYAISDRIDLLVRIVDLTQIELSDLSAETAGLIRSEAKSHIGRCALVGDTAWVSEISHLAFTGAELEIRRFAPEHEADAWQWLGTRELAADA